MRLSLKKFNTFGIEAFARNILFLKELKQLETIPHLKDCLFIGGGSNIYLQKILKRP